MTAGIKAVGQELNADEVLGMGHTEEVRVIPDFLPSPEELVFREEKVKVTIALSKNSVEFFKREAAKSNVSYQRMIRRLLDEYAQYFAG